MNKLILAVAVAATMSSAAIVPAEADDWGPRRPWHYFEYKRWKRHTFCASYHYRPQGCGAFHARETWSPAIHFFRRR